MIHPDLNFHIDFAVECLLKIKKGKCLKAGFAYGCVLNDFECFHLPVRYEQQRHSQTKLCVLVHSCTLWYECARQRQLYLPIQSVAFDQLTPLWMNTMTSQQNCFDNVSNCFRALTAIQPGRERGEGSNPGSSQISAEEKKVMTIHPSFQMYSLIWQSIQMGAPFVAFWH